MVYPVLCVYSAECAAEISLKQRCWGGEFFFWFVGWVTLLYGPVSVSWHRHVPTCLGRSLMIDEVFVRVLQYVRSASADGRALWGEFHTDSLFASLPLYPCSITQLPPSKSLAAAVAPQFLIRFSQSRRRLSCVVTRFRFSFPETRCGVVRTGCGLQQDRALLLHEGPGCLLPCQRAGFL